LTQRGGAGLASSPPRRFAGGCPPIPDMTQGASQEFDRAAV
jgi:hypothetical protein